MPLDVFSKSRVQSCSFTWMRPVTPPLIHKHCQPSSFLLIALRHTPVCAHKYEPVHEPCLRKTQEPALPVLPLCRVSAASSSVLLEMERTFPIIMEGRYGLYLLLSLLCLSAGISGISAW
ncbi:hypothetical protein GOODEAATRI_033919 [Goodea atripinnis]|uniref:Uncharacterized protein n=1 Tax=Goodea atripinnis TaxID=208336 RepID=A0ABV0NQF2_9TELE